MKRVLLFTTCGLTIVVGALLYTIHGHDRALPAAGAVRVGARPARVSARPARVSARPARAGARPSPARRLAVRAEIQRIIRQEVDELAGGEDRLERYLETLVARAEARGRVTALEVQPGLAAIRRQVALLEPGRALQLELVFSRRMREMSRRLAGGRLPGGRLAGGRLPGGRPEGERRMDQPPAGPPDLLKAIETKRSMLAWRRKEGQAVPPGRGHALLLRQMRR
jgi:hypothetical protein